MTHTPSKSKRFSAATLLVEVGTEELPPRALARLGEAFATAVAKHLSEHALVADAKPVWYATPRRLAVTIPAVLRRQPDRISERRGPSLTKAFDAAGLPTAAATATNGRPVVIIRVCKFNNMHTECRILLYIYAYCIVLYLMRVCCQLNKLHLMFVVVVV